MCTYVMYNVSFIHFWFLNLKMLSSTFSFLGEEEINSNPTPNIFRCYDNVFGNGLLPSILKIFHPKKLHSYVSFLIFLWLSSL